MSPTSRSKRTRRFPTLLALAITALVVSATPAPANPLVTRDGSVIEARGPWKVQGRLVVFELPDGRLASLQLGEVDLEASRAAAAPPRVAAVEPPAPKRPQGPAVVVLTDADFRKAPPPGDSPGSGPDAGEADELPERDQRLIVSSWREAGDADGVVVTGELLNQSPDFAADIQLAVLFYDRQGDLLKSTMASVTSEVLQPGQRARFRADAEGVFDYASVKFEAASLGFCGRFRGGTACGEAGAERARDASTAKSAPGGA